MVEQVNENAFLFAIPHVADTKMQLEFDKIPPEVRLDLLRKAVEGYVRNSVNQAHIRHSKALEPWTAYDNAQAADAMQTAVPKPEGERPTVDLTEVAAAARQRLYEGNVKKAGQRKARKSADPLEALITQAVTREVFDKSKAENDNYKWTDAVKAISEAGGGREYLEAKIAERVAAGADEAELRKFMETRYIQPAKLMLGQRDTASTKGESLL